MALVVYDTSVPVRYWIAAKRRGYAMPTAMAYNYPLGLKPLPEFVRGIRGGLFIPLLLKWFNETSSRTAVRHFVLQWDFTTAEPDNIKAMLSGQGAKSFSIGQRSREFKPLLGVGIFTAEGEHWKHARGVLRPMFSREQLGRLKVIDDHAETLIRRIRQQCESPGSVVDIGDLFQKLTMDTITHILFGQTVDSLSSTTKYLETRRGPVLSTDIANAMLKATSGISVRSRAGSFYWMFNGREFREAVSVCNDFVEYLIDQAVDQVKNHKEKLLTDENSCVVLNQLVQETQDTAFIRDQMFSLIFAGRDTTASFLSYIFYELGKNPEIYQKLRKTVLETFGTTSENITFESLKRCTYLSNILNEALRVHPTVPVNYRYAFKDTELPLGGGPDGKQPVFIQKGQRVIYSVHLMHNDKEIWGPDASVFNPDRWLSEEMKERHSWAYIPFNGGPRICIGQQFALIEAGLVTVKLVQAFPHIFMPYEVQNKPLLEETTITIRPRDVTIRLS